MMAFGISTLSLLPIFACAFYIWQLRDNRSEAAKLRAFGFFIAAFGWWMGWVSVCLLILMWRTA